MWVEASKKNWCLLTDASYVESVVSHSYVDIIEAIRILGGCDANMDLFGLECILSWRSLRVMCGLQEDSLNTNSPLSSMEYNDHDLLRDSLLFEAVAHLHFCQKLCGLKSNYTPIVFHALPSKWMWQSPLSIPLCIFHKDPPLFQLVKSPIVISRMLVDILPKTWSVQVSTPLEGYNFLTKLWLSNETIGPLCAYIQRFRWAWKAWLQDYSLCFSIYSFTLLKYYRNTSTEHQKIKLCTLADVLAADRMVDIGNAAWNSCIYDNNPIHNSIKGKAVSLNYSKYGVDGGLMSALLVPYLIEQSWGRFFLTLWPLHLSSAERNCIGGEATLYTSALQVLRSKEV